MEGKPARGMTILDGKQARQTMSQDANKRRQMSSQMNNELNGEQAVKMTSRNNGEPRGLRATFGAGAVLIDQMPSTL